MLAHPWIVTPRFGEYGEASGQIRLGELANHLTPPQRSRYTFSLGVQAELRRSKGTVLKRTISNRDVVIWSLVVGGRQLLCCHLRETERPGYSSAVIENPGIEPRGSLSASIRAPNI